MLGTLRLLLAAMVVAYHGGLRIAGIQIGVVAVIVFYVISGFAMTGLLNARFPQQKDAPSFYAERIVRLVPQYYFWIVAALLASYFDLRPVRDAYSFPSLFAYATIIPLGLQRFIESPIALTMPQATTLGIEASFYIFSPWILRSRGLSWAGCIACLGIFLATAVNAIPGNIYTYYTTPGPLIFYLLGSFLYRKDWPSVAVFLACLLAILGLNVARHFEAEYLIGAVVGLPAVALLSRFKSNTFDALLGNASYGCYLCHSLVLAAARRVYGGQPEMDYFFWGSTILISIACGYISFLLIERPTLAYRRRLKGRPMQNLQEAQPAAETSS